MSDAGPQPQVARFRDLRPNKSAFANPTTGVPEAAYEMVAAKENMLVMAPEGHGRSMVKPAIVGPPGVEVTLTRCPPGAGAALHIHQRSSETFMSLSGRWQVFWGEQGEQSVELATYDTITLPTGIYRGFKNVGDTDALLLVIIGGGTDAVMQDILFNARSGEQIAQKFGTDVKDNFKKIGIEFAR